MPLWPGPPKFQKSGRPPYESFLGWKTKPKFCMKKHVIWHLYPIHLTLPISAHRPCRLSVICKLQSDGCILQTPGKNHQRITYFGDFHFLIVLPDVISMGHWDRPPDHLLWRRLQSVPELWHPRLKYMSELFYIGMNKLPACSKKTPAYMLHAK